MVDTDPQAKTGSSLSSSGSSPAVVPEQRESSHTPSLPDYSQSSGTSTRFLTVFYSPVNPTATPPTALIPWTNDYEAALASAEQALRRHLASSPTNKQRWLALRVQTSVGARWAEFLPEQFPSIVNDPAVELRLCEDHASKPAVTLLPIGHERAATKEGVSYRFKIITVGPMSVGKSMMLQYFTTPEEGRLETLSNTNAPKLDVTDRFMTAQGVLVKLSLWDTAGQERFRALTKSHYRGAHGVFLVYSIADAKSFRSCTEWLAEIQEHVDKNVPIMLIGNQVDRVTERAVETSTAQAFALKHGLLFEEISGLQGINVERVFQRLVQEIFRGLKDRDELDECKETRQSSRSVNLRETPQQSSGGCISSVGAMIPDLGIWEAGKRMFGRSTQ